MSDKIKLIINNWLGKVSFESTKDEIDEFLDDYEWEYDENNDTIESYGDFFSEPYYSLDSSGKFVVVSEYTRFPSNLCGYGYSFEFINCDCPVGLEEYISEGDWVFTDEYEELIKVNKSKFSEIFKEGYPEITNRGSGCLRISDFNYKEFFDFIGVKEKTNPKEGRLNPRKINSNECEDIGKGDVQQGERKGYYKSGELEFTANYVDGVLEGEWKTYFKSGQLLYTANFVDNLQQGESKFYYESGKLQRIVNYVDGLQQGEHISYYESGELEFTVNNVDGLTQGEAKTYGKTGELLSTINWVDGVRQ